MTICFTISDVFLDRCIIPLVPQCASVTRLRRFGSDKTSALGWTTAGFPSNLPPSRAAAIFGISSTWFTPPQLFSLSSAPADFWDLGVIFLSYSHGSLLLLVGLFFCFSTFVSLFSSPNRAYRWQRCILRLVSRIYPTRLVAVVFVARRGFADEDRLGLHPCPLSWASIAYGTLDGYPN